MKTRRGFIATSLGLITSLGLFQLPGISLVGSAFAKAKKKILPATTRMMSLIRMDPRNLDTRNLPVTPLEGFDTMGETKHKTRLEDWRLKITVGEGVKQSLTYDEMLELPAIERKVLLICPGFFAQHGNWKGLDMNHLLNSLDIDTRVTEVEFSGPTISYKSQYSFSIKDVRTNRVFLAYQVNGSPLPEKHGFPLRVVAEDVYGGRWVKYVDSVKMISRKS